MSPDRVSPSLQNSNSVSAGHRRGRSPSLPLCSQTWRVRPRLLPKTAPEVFLIALAVGEAGAGGLGPTDAAAVQAPVHFWLVKAKHLHRDSRQ